MTKVDFIIVGAERCGTTSIYHNLCKHSGVQSAYTKEIQFFDKYYNEGVDWYHKQFDKVDGMLIGEATPTYFWNPKAAERIWEYASNMKIIITLRPKSDAMFSKWNQQVNKGVETLSYTDALLYENVRIKGDIERTMALPYNYYPSLYSEFAYSKRYDYEKHLKLWEPFNPLVINDYFNKPAKRMNQIFDFLGLPQEDIELGIMNKGIYLSNKENSNSFIE